MKSENWISAALSRAPPPKRPAVLPVKVTPVRLETPPAVNKPPPSVVVAIFEVNVPPLIVAVPAVSTNTPPPLICAPLPPKFVLSRVRVPELKIAPPRPIAGVAGVRREACVVGVQGGGCYRGCRAFRNDCSSIQPGGVIGEGGASDNQVTQRGRSRRRCRWSIPENNCRRRPDCC